MKKLFTCFITVILSAILMFGIVGCDFGGNSNAGNNSNNSSGNVSGTGVNQTEISNSKKVKYKLSSVKFSNLTVNHYDYNYIEFNFGKNTYYLENKSKQNGIVTKQKGSFSVNGKNVTITNSDIPTQNYLLSPNETLSFSGDDFKVEAYVAEYGGVCYFIYTK